MVYLVDSPRLKKPWEYRSPQAAEDACHVFYRKYGSFPDTRKEVRQLKPLKVSKAGISEFRRIMRKLERQNPCTRTVEFDGASVVTHGEIDLDRPV